MNCEICKDSFNLNDKVPFVLNCCQSVVCQQCSKKKLNNMNQCPLCQINQSFDMYSMQECKSVMNLMAGQIKILLCSDHKQEVKFYNKKDKKYLCEKCNDLQSSAKNSFKNSLNLDSFKNNSNLQNFDSSQFFRDLKRLKDSLEKEMKKDQFYQVLIRKLNVQDNIETNDIMDFQKELHANIMYEQFANMIFIKNRITFGNDSVQSIFRNEAVSEQIDSLKNQIETLKQKNVIINQNNSDFKQQCEVYKAQLEKTQVQSQNDIKQLQQVSITKYENLKAINLQLQNDLKQAQKQIQMFQETHIDLINQHDDVKNENIQITTQSQQDIKLLNSQLQNSVQKLTQQKQLYDKLYIEKEQILKEKNDLEQGLNINQNHHEKLKFQHQRVSQIVIDKDQHIENLSSQLKQLTLFQDSHLITIEGFSLIQKWMELPNLKLNLIYKGTQHGFTSDSFHLLCDNQGQTITVIKSDQKQVFGGYSAISWNKKETWISGEGKSFVFSLTKKTKHNCIKKESEIYGHSGFLANFGNGFDICINNQANESKNYSRLGASYELQNDLKYGSDQANSYLGGLFFFKVEEIEVFKIIQ